MTATGDEDDAFVRLVRLASSVLHSAFRPEVSRLERGAASEPGQAAPASQRSYRSANWPPRASSWSGGPTSATWPSSITAIWSASITVESRWAITMVVRPWRSRRIASVTRVSVATSRLLVASSRMSRAGSASQAGRRRPAGVHRPRGRRVRRLRCRSRGEGQDHRLGADRPGGRLDLLSCRLGAAEADVVGHRGLLTAKAGEQEPVLWELVLLRVPERADLGVQVGADPADLALADAAVSNQRPDQGHGGLCPFASTIGVVSLVIARWLPTQSRPATYTTLRDTTGGRNRRLVPAEVSTV